MLEHLTRNFRQLLEQFDGGLCPLCGVLKARARENLEAVRVRDASASTTLCGLHLGMMLDGVEGLPLRARWARASIQLLIMGQQRCDVCATLNRVELRLVRTIRRLDSGMRFIKALESAPLFCRRHAQAITTGQVADNFAHVQRGKLIALRDGLAQAELRNSRDLESLISTALAYLGRQDEQQPPAKIERIAAVESTGDDATDPTQEFERWDEARDLKRLARLESEAASLRYRNAILFEENRRLKLAHMANEAIRRDLEHDRAQLLAAVRESNPLKSPNEH